MAWTGQTSLDELFDKAQTDCPQWGDIGMYDLLAAPPGVSLTPPTTVRVVSNSPVGITPTVNPHRLGYAHVLTLRPVSSGHVQSGYIYLLSCLRL